MDITPRRRSAISTILAIVLAVESVSAVAAAAGVSTRQAGQAGPADLSDTTGGRPGAAVAVRATLPVVGDPRQLALGAVGPAGAGPVAEPAAVGSPALPPKAAIEAPLRTPEAKHEFKVVKPGSGGSGGKASPASYRGRNHVWIPSLGINRSVSFFPCDRKRPPDNYVYRWGCAGANNVYLMGHAHSVFRSLHNAYVSGRLRKGMKVWYANGSGKVRVYSVRWWKVTAPTTSAKWAWAAQSVPSMTLQTCVGKDGQYRLMVRLVEVGH